MHLSFPFAPLNNWFTRVTLTAMVTAWTTGGAYAEDRLHYDLVHLSASAQGQVSNDTLVVTLVAQAQEKTAARAADIVNKAMADALRQVATEDDIEAQTLSYNTQPRYQNEKIYNWQVQQSLQLKSTDIELLSAKLGDLQASLSVRNMQYAVSPDLRREKENALISEAVEAFNDKARLLANAFGAKDYRLVSVNVGSNGTRPPMPVESYGRMAMAADVAPAAVELGTQTVQVTVDGQVELVY